MAERSLATVSRNRAALYHWFALAFLHPPGEAQVVALQQGDAHTLLESIAAVPGALNGVMAMRHVFDLGAPAQVAASLQAAHVRLFDGVGGYVAAPPYRSVYTSERGLLFQQATAEMERLLQQFNLAITHKVNEPADHLSLQLEVMSELALRLADAAEQTHDLAPAALLAEQINFIEGQLLNWVGLFAQRLGEVDALGFYAGLASVLEVMLQQDRRYLSND